VTAALDGGPYLIFDLGGPDSAGAAPAFAIDVRFVLQVLEAEGATPVPLAPDVVEGIINHHGRILTVVDPAPLLELPPQPQAVSQVVILRRAGGAASQVGLKVARTREIVAAGRLEPVDVAGGPAVRCVVRRDHGLIHIVSHEAVLAELGRRFGVDLEAMAAEA
jgi:purine-binding chemotaxis protein CheW